MIPDLDITGPCFVSVLRANLTDMFTDAEKWVAAMHEHGRNNPKHLWVSADYPPYISVVAFDPYNPDPSHVVCFSVTLGAIRDAVKDGDEELKHALKNPKSRIEFARKFQITYHKPDDDA